MNVLLQALYFPPEVGGMESHVHQLARGLVRRGHRVTVVTGRSLPGLASREEMDGIDVHRLPFPGRHPLGWALHVAATVPRVLELARECDVVHAHSFAVIPPGALARRRHGVPLVATIHTSHFLARAQERRWRPILHGLLRRPDHLLAPSRELARVAGELSGGRSVEAVTNGVDTDLFRPVNPSLPSDSGTGPRLVVPRRLFHKNGVEFVIRALPPLREEFPSLEVLVGGDGPERERLEGLAEDLGVAGAVRFLGAQSHEAMPGLLASADVAVFPSLMEATSVAALEAMACGLPVAASRVGGLPEIVDQEVGTLFAPADPGELAGKTAELLRAPDLRQRGRRARQRVEAQWSNERLVDHHEALYRRLASGRGEPGHGGRGAAGAPSAEGEPEPEPSSE